MNEKDVYNVHQRWIATERILGIVTLLALTLFVSVFVPDSYSLRPADVLCQEISEPVCPDVALRTVNLREELGKPNPDFTDADLRNMDLSGITFSPATKFENADLSGALLNNVSFDRVKMRCARLVTVRADKETPPKFLAVDLTRAKLNDARLNGAVFQFSDLTASDLSDTQLEGADLRDTNFTGAKLDGTSIANARLGASDFCRADYRPVDAPIAGDAEKIVNIDRVSLSQPELAGLRQLERAFNDVGLGDKETRISATADRWQRHFNLEERDASTGQIISIWVKASVFGWATGDGTQPIKPFWLLAVTTLSFAIVYWIALFADNSSKRKLFYRIRAGDSPVQLPIPEGIAQTVAPAVIFSLSTAALIALQAFKVLNVLDLTSKSISGSASYAAKGWVRWLAMSQAFVTLSLLLIWIIR